MANNYKVQFPNIRGFAESLCWITPSISRKALQELFALGCYFRLIGKRQVGYKICTTVVDAVQLRKEKAKIIVDDLNGR